MTAAAAVAVFVLFKRLTHILHELIEYRVKHAFIVCALKFH